MASNATNPLLASFSRATSSSKRSIYSCCAVISPESLEMVTSSTLAGSGLGRLEGGLGGGLRGILIILPKVFAREHFYKALRSRRVKKPRNSGSCFIRSRA